MYNALTLDEREQYAIQPIDYTDYNMRIPLSPSITHRSGDWWNPDSDDEIMNNEWRRRHEYNKQPTSFEIRWGVQRWNRYRRDHPRACGGKLTPVPEQPFDLLGLSPELRRLVFRYLFRGQLIQSQGVLIHMADDNSAGVDGDQKEPFDVRVFAVSRLIKQEAMEVFFVDNVFRIHVCSEYAPDCRYGENTRPLSVFLRHEIFSWPIERLRRFDIVVFVDELTHLRSFGDVAKRYVFTKQV